MQSKLRCSRLRAALALGAAVSVSALSAAAGSEPEAQIFSDGFERADAACWRGSSPLGGFVPGCEASLFEDVRAISGIDYTNVPFGTIRLGGGVAVADVNTDGWPDVLLTGGPRNGLYLNQGGTGFARAGASWGLDGFASLSATFADYDNDGDPDLILGQVGPNEILRNEGDHFVRVTDALGLPGSLYVTFAGALADYDGDGDLDLFFGNYWDLEPGGASPYAPDVLLRNDGAAFTDVSTLLPVDPYQGPTYAAAWTDIDHDGDPDLYVVRDVLGMCAECTPNDLFRNDATESESEAFSAISEASGTDVRMAAMGIAVGDYDGDGWQDLYVSNGGGEVLLHNLGGGSFERAESTVGAVAATLDAPYRTISWGVEFFDATNDTRQDLFVVFGQIDGVPESGIWNRTDQPNAFLLNRGGDFEVVTSGAEQRSALENDGFARGIGVLDMDLDGCLDLIVGHMVGAPGVFHNRCAWGQHWIGVRLVGTTSNRDAVGAVVQLTADGVTQRAEVGAGSSSLMSSRWKTVHFGLAAASSIESLVVTWPSGLVESFPNVPVDAYTSLTEGTGQSA